jgi:hypothetical protein
MGQKSKKYCLLDTGVEKLPTLRKLGNLLDTCVQWAVFFTLLTLVFDLIMLDRKINAWDVVPGDLMYPLDEKKRHFFALNSLGSL